MSKWVEKVATGSERARGLEAEVHICDSGGVSVRHRAEETDLILFSPTYSEGATSLHASTPCDVAKFPTLRSRAGPCPGTTEYSQ